MAAGDIAQTTWSSSRAVRRRGWHGPPLTGPQQRVLAALVELSPEAGGDTAARAVAERAGLRLGSVVVILRSLAQKRLAIWHQAESPDEEDGWAPSMSGHARVRTLRDAA